MKTSQAVRIVEVGPRDGLQNIPEIVSTRTKAELIMRLADCGLKTIEVTSFVSPKSIPQLADNKEVVAAIRPLLANEDIRFPVLVPNVKGLEGALRHELREVSVFVSASEGFSQKNTNCSVAEGLRRARDVATLAAQRGVAVRGYVSCIFACPYDGPTPPSSVLRVTRELLDAGCYEVSLGDTLGVGTPADVATVLSSLQGEIHMSRIAGHFHDTYGQAVANVMKAYEMGLRVFDSSVSGLGGCPYAPGAKGNLATEDIVYTFNKMGVNTGIDLPKLVSTGAWISNQLGRRNESRAGAALASLSRSTDAPPSSPSLTWDVKHATPMINLAKSGLTAKITLTRPRHGNVLTTEMINNLIEMFQAASKSKDINRIVLTGEGKYFCTGMDLGSGTVSPTASSSLSDTMFSGLLSLFDAISTSPKTTIALINGPCYGGGIGLAFACDIRLAVTSATFTLSEARLGLAPAVISKYVTREWGTSFTRAAMLTGRAVSAAELQRIGAIHATYEDSKLLHCGLEHLVSTMKSCAPGASSLCKDLVRIGWEDPNGPHQQGMIRTVFREMTASDESRYGKDEFKKGNKAIDWDRWTSSRIMETAKL
ncbi:3-hydroxy-3-methylglutaryl-coenzyme A lyase/3-methylglutaconyl-coenzyme A hydratase [Thozetella sp. PMI_491]|nr:3-hydroxy-3-methylglutaryl-coenzyme A lyase/3-methylglutaconyl-coenzyme A hydratase [Thozetella sp. PMI_491]